MQADVILKEPPPTRTPLSNAGFIIYQINVKTVKPIRPEFVVVTHRFTTGQNIPVLPPYC